MVKKNRRKIPFSWKRVAFIVAVGALIIALINIGLRKYITASLSQRIPQIVAKSSHGLYHIYFDDVKTNMIVGNISFFNVAIKLDTAVYQVLQKQTKKKYLLRDFRALKIDIRHINLWKAVFYQTIDIKSILVDKPTITIVRQWPVDELPFSDKTIYQKLKEHVSSLHIGEIHVSEMAVNYIDNKRSAVKVTRLNNIGLNAKDVLIDSLSEYNQSRLWYTKDIVASIENYQYETDDKSYTIRFDEMSTSTAKADIKVAGLQIIPNYAEMDSLFKRRDRYSMASKEIVLDKINYHLLIARGQLMASSLAIKEANLDIFVNRMMTDTVRNRAKNFPSLALKRIPLNIQLDTIKLDHAKVSYSEYNPLSNAKGTVYFDRINGKLEYITNNNYALIKKRFCAASATGLLMGNVPLAVDLKFDLLDTLGAFLFSGKLGQMNARILNPVLPPLALIKVGKGLVENISFKGSGDIHGCQGNLTAKYNQLRIGILKKDSTKFKRQTLASLYTNIVVLRNENPNKEEGLLYTSTFEYKRPLQASFFKVIWKGIAVGLMDNIGLGIAAQAHLKSKSKYRK